MGHRVIWDKTVEKTLAKIPAFIRDKFIAWALVVEREDGTIRIVEVIEVSKHEY